VKPSVGKGDLVNY